MPRMNTCEEELLPASGALLANCSLRNHRSSTSVRNTCRSSSAAPVSAVMAMGVFCRSSCTLRAVTMISSRPTASCSWANADGANAAVAAMASAWLMAIASGLNCCFDCGLVFMVLPW
jgi:hypothetical protein